MPLEITIHDIPGENTQAVTGKVNDRVAQLVGLQQDEIYIGALNKVSALILQNLHNTDFAEYPLPTVLTWETIIQYFFAILFRNIEEIKLSAQEFQKLKQYLEVKNATDFPDEVVLERVMQGITLGVMDLHNCLLVVKNYGIDIQVMQRLIYLNLIGGTANASKVFTTVIEDTVKEFGGNPSQAVLLERLEAVNKTNLEQFSNSSLSACPFSRSPYKKEWVTGVFEILAQKYLPELRKLQGGGKGVLHDFYTQNI